MTHAPAAARLQLVAAALAVLDRGPYLGRIQSPWIDERRERLARRAAGW